MRRRAFATVASAGCTVRLVDMPDAARFYRFRYLGKEFLAVNRTLRGVALEAAVRAGGTFGGSSAVRARTQTRNVFFQRRLSDPVRFPAPPLR